MEGCRENKQKLILEYNGKILSYPKIIDDLHQFTTIFMESDNDKILEITEDFLKKNKKSLNNGDLLETDTTPYEGFDKHITIFQKREGEFRVEVFIDVSYFIH